MPKICQFKIKRSFNIKLFKPFFKNLKIDKNDKKLYGIKPFRSRQILYTQFEDDVLRLVNKNSFVQNVSDVRKHKRKFSIFNPTDQQLKLLEKLLKFALKKCCDTMPSNQLDVTFHFVKIYASKLGTTNSPEGIHRDGYDILVPCIVIDRKNIVGGSSRFYRNKELIFDRIMKEGEGIIFKENSNPDLFHDVSYITLKDKKKEGWRSIIGIDINFI